MPTRRPRPFGELRAVPQAAYTVRAADCDMYNVLFQARVPSFLEACHSTDASSFYVNIRASVRPGDVLKVQVFFNEERFARSRVKCSGDGGLHLSQRHLGALS